MSSQKVIPCPTAKASAGFYHFSITSCAPICRLMTSVSPEPRNGEGNDPAACMMDRDQERATETWGGGQTKQKPALLVGSHSSALTHNDTVGLHWGLPDDSHFCEPHLWEHQPHGGPWNWTQQRLSIRAHHTGVSRTGHLPRVSHWSPPNHY